MKPQFRWTCSYQGTQWFEVRDASGTYKLEFRHKLDDYEASTLNGAAFVQECRDAIGILRREHLTAAECHAWRDDNATPCFAVPQETVDAFNAWQLEERAAFVAKMKADPKRYGEIDESDPFLFPPIIPARRGWYVNGLGWQWEGKEHLATAA